MVGQEEKIDPKKERKSLETILKNTEGAVYASQQRAMFTYYGGGKLAEERASDAGRLYAMENSPDVSKAYAEQGAAQLRGEQGQDYWTMAATHARQHFDTLGYLDIKEIMERIASRGQFSKQKIKEIVSNFRKLYGRTFSDLKKAKEAGDKEAEKHYKAIEAVYTQAVGIKYDIKMAIEGGQKKIEDYLNEAYKEPEPEEQEQKKAA